MSYSIYLALAAATAGLRHHPDDSATEGPGLADTLQPALQGICRLAERFQRGSVSPLSAARFEKDLQLASRELARLTVQWTYNYLEPADISALPVEVRSQGSTFRRLAKKTPQQVSTLFGPISLCRLGYRAAASQGEPVLFPLCRQLGLAHGASPAVLECVGRYQAEAGATQRQTLRRLRTEHGLSWGVKRLRQVTDFVAQAVQGHRQEA